MTDEEREAIEWIYNCYGTKIGPHVTWGQGPETEAYGCYGCKGEFISRWPRWEEPTLKTFPHEKDCKYVKSLKVLKLTK